MTNRFVNVIVTSIIIVLCFTGCGASPKKETEVPSVSTVSGDTELSDNIDNSENQNNELVQKQVLGCTISLPSDWKVSDDYDAALVFKEDDSSYDIGINLKYCHVDIPNWDDQYNLFLQYLEKQGYEVTNSGIYTENGLQGYYAEYQGEDDDIKCIEYVFNANNKGTVHINYTVSDNVEFKYLDDFNTIISTLDVSGVPKLIEERLNNMDGIGISEEEMQEIIKEEKEGIQKVNESHEDFVW